MRYRFSFTSIPKQFSQFSPLTTQTSPLFPAHANLEAQLATLQAMAEAGTLKRYTGRHYGMHNHLVKVLKPILNDDEEPTGRVEVLPYMPREGRFSRVSSDPLETELVPVTAEEVAAEMGGTR